MDRLVPALMLLGMPLTVTWLAARRWASAWRLVALGGATGVVAGAVLLLGLSASSGAVADTSPWRLAPGVLLGIAAVGGIVGSVVAITRAWWRASERDT
jgi:hypothetical protein